MRPSGPVPRGGPRRRRHAALGLLWALASGGAGAAQETAPAQVETGAAAAGAEPVLTGAGGGSSPPVPAQERLEETCLRIARKLASVSRRDCLEAGLAATGWSSVKGTPLLVREFSPVEERRPLGRVLLIGGIHGDEYSSVSVVFKWLRILDRHHSGLFHWRIAPLVNPDGLLRRRSTRMNDNGVDLNRNFPCPDWHAATSDYWVRRTSRNPRRYPGPDPLSEPESRWLAEEIEDFQPDVIVSVHAPHNVLDFDGPPEPPERLGPLQLKLMGTYPGSLGRYAGVHNRLPVVTIELPSAGSMPTVEEQREIWVDLVRWLRQRLRTPAMQAAR